MTGPVFGENDGDFVGLRVGCKVGFCEGFVDGTRVGLCKVDGTKVGDK